MRVGDLVGQLHVGVGSHVGALTWFPIWCERGLPAGCSLLPRDGALSIRECPEPTVERLVASNCGTSPALLLQGSTLRGGNQDRTCAATVLVPPRTEVKVPVACIERGRWSATGPDLHLTDRIPPRVRARNAAAAAPQRGGRGTVDQAGTWWEIDALFGAYGQQSATDSYHDLRRDPRSVTAVPVRPLDGQRGVVIGYAGQVRSLELFGSSRDLATLLHDTLMAAQIEAAAAAPAPAPVSARRARRAVADLRRLEVAATPSLGWGEDLRGQQSGLIASGLNREGSLLHLAAFNHDLALAT
jgi:hypothetical protein